jgi:glycosyltransferase involved in cell wall biosynthesis
VGIEERILLGFSDLTTERYCVVIPVFNHDQNIESLVQEVTNYELSCFLIDDGSNNQCKANLSEVVARNWPVDLITLQVNQGKGVAVTTGLKQAFERGYSHAIQIDADAQHSTKDIPRFLAASRTHPDHVISGFRPYRDLPLARRLGRRLTDFWVCVNTLSVSIRDSMCGYRLYPLETSVRLINNTTLCRRMDFDTDILVKLFWSGVRVTHVDISVSYDSTIPSHFKLFQDNLRITLMHTRHFATMLWRLISRPRHFLRPKC